MDSPQKDKKAEAKNALAGLKMKNANGALMEDSDDSPEKLLPVYELDSA